MTISIRTQVPAGTLPSPASSPSSVSPTHISSHPTPPSPSPSSKAHQLPAVLHLTLPAVHSISGPDGLSSLWHVFSKCKSSLQDGERLENISWRLWAQACADEYQKPKPVGGAFGGGANAGKHVIVMTPGRDGTNVELVSDRDDGGSERSRGDDESGSSDWEDAETSGSSSVSGSSGASPTASGSLQARRQSASGAGRSAQPPKDFRSAGGQVDEVEAEEAIVDEDDDDSSGFETASDSGDDVEALTMNTTRFTPTTASTRIVTPSASTLASRVTAPAPKRRGTNDLRLETTSDAPTGDRQRKSSFASSSGSKTSSAVTGRKSSMQTVPRDRKGSRSSQADESSSNRSTRTKALPTPAPSIPTSTTATPGLSTSTPKASSYPTPSQSIRPYAFMRSQSHLPGDPINVLPESALASAAAKAEQQRQAAQAEVQAQMFALAKARRANRPFGEVLKDMFRVPSVNEVVEACAAASASGSGEELKRKISIGGLGVAAPPAPVMIEATQMTPVVQPQVEQDSYPMDTDSPSGPEFRLVEPTPVPSRVGSLSGTSLILSRNSLLARHDAGHSSASPRPSSHASGFGAAGLGPMTRMRSASSGLSHSPVYSPQLEKADPMASLTVSPAPLTPQVEPRSNAVVSSPSLLAAAHPPQIVQPTAAPTSKGKDKKSMFYIQSPGDRYDSVSGSETSMSSMASGQSQRTQMSSKVGGSPLAATQMPVIDNERTKQAILALPSARTNEHDSVMRSPEEALTRVPSRRFSGASAGSNGKQSHQPPPHGRRTSGEANKDATKTHATRQMGAAAGLNGPKRTGSAAQMAGKFQGEKARAAAAIAARLQAQQELDRQKQVEQRRQHLTMAKRQQSAPNLEQLRQNAARSVEVVTESNEDDEDWSSETDEASDEAKGALMFGKGKGKGKGKSLPMDLAKAADEAQRQRELFAKKAIFGSVPRPEVPGLSGVSGGSRVGLLSNLFETQRDVIRKGDSMVNLQRALPSTDHLHTRQSHGLAGNFPLNRSKSVVAMPQTSGVSVGRSGFVPPPHVVSESPQTASSLAHRGKHRLPPRPGPAALAPEDMSPSSSPENDTSILATSAAVKRLEAIGARRQSKHSTQTPLQEEQAAASVQAAINQTVQAVATQPMQRASSNPITTQYNPHSNSSLEPSMPQTPTTRRRQMLATELPEDLRLNLLWERRSRAPMYPNKRSSGLKPSASTHDLPTTNPIQRELPDGPSPDLRRQLPENPSGQTQPHGSYEGPAAAQRRKPGPNLLSGGNLLRPMTSLSRRPDIERPASASGGVTQAAAAERQRSNLDPSLAQRSMSVVNMAEYNQQQHQQALSGGQAVQQGEGNLRRRMTDGDAGPEQARRTRNLREREEESSSSFRSHGW